MSVSGRPAFIPREVFRAWLTPSTLNHYLRVGGIQASSYLQRRAREGRPVRSANGRYRPLDIVASARAAGDRVEPPASAKALDAESREAALAFYREEVGRLTCLADEARAERVRQHAMRNPELPDEVFHRWARRLRGRRLLREEEIVAAGAFVPNVSGVYFLICDNRVLYVGQSSNVYPRVSNHLRDSLHDFDRVAVIECPAEELDVLESLYIWWLQPEGNGRYTRQGQTGMHAPLTLARLAEMAPD